MGSPVEAGRRIAGLLGYNPGPGLYSRMTRAVEGMPKVIRTQELPGLLRKYPEGVPGWEVNAVAPALEGVQSIPRQDLLDLIQQHSPAYTHREVILGGRPPRIVAPHGFFDESRSAAGLDMETNSPDVAWVPEGSVFPQYQDRPAPLGRGVSHAVPAYERYGQGGNAYSELLLLQPGAKGNDFGSHWPRDNLTGETVAHARYDTHGDALRINELQSDLGIHNRKAREATAGFVAGGGLPDHAPRNDLPFPLEDAWADILIKRLALEAARGGHRAIEIASPRAIADKVGGNIENYQHFYGKVVPGAIERLGRKMGGVTDVTPVQQELLPGYSALAEEAMGYTEPYKRGLLLLRDISPPGPRPAFQENAPDMAFRKLTEQDTSYGREDWGKALHGAVAEDLQRGGMSAEEAYVAAAQHMPTLMRMAEDQAEAYERFASLRDLGFAQNSVRRQSGSANQSPRRYLMSDEMRKRILEGGIGLSVLGGLASQEE